MQKSSFQFLVKLFQVQPTDRKNPQELSTMSKKIQITHVSHKHAGEYNYLSSANSLNALINVSTCCHREYSKLELIDF